MVSQVGYINEGWRHGGIRPFKMFTFIILMVLNPNTSKYYVEEEDNIFF